MGITLYVMRHGHAVNKASSDAERPLSANGEIEVRKAAHKLEGLQPDLFIASPYLRAQQTARILKEAAAIPTDITTEEGITPDDHPQGVVRMLADLEAVGSILMVSHNPLVSALVSLLVDGDLQGGYAMGTASVACIEFDEILGVGQGRLQWLS
ncbi:MAG: phosphohistidine phosphatase SixA [Ketobacteraceae bacterium]|nr:phosphohistidine phosphatase SixA [Ketobacteraceae bacterium]